MKIVHVESGRNLYGGAQQVVYLLEGLAKRGVENILVCPPGAAIGRYFKDSDVRVVEMVPSSLNFRFAFALEKLLRQEKPDIAHLHSRRGADVFGAVAAFRAKVPSILSRRIDNPVRNFVSRHKYRYYDRIICISQGIKKVLLDAGIEEARLNVVRSAVDARPWQSAESKSTFAAEFQLPEDALYVGVVAQLIERKGHHILLEALRNMPERDRLRIIIFGKGPQREVLERLVREMGLHEIVRFAGFRDDLPRWMGALDMLVHPALMEGMGISLLQASAAQVPIVASDVGGIPEAVRHGENGILVPPNDAMALRAAIRKLVQDAPLRRRMGETGRRIVTEEFSIDGMVEGNLSVYNVVNMMYKENTRGDG
jgi:glycosyltransferase involved in cell wall biosynthesis